MRRSGSLTLVLALAVAVFARRAAAGPTVDAAKLGFTFTLPDGFENPDANAGGAPAGMAFKRGQPGVGSFAVLEIVPMAGTIGPEKLNRKGVEESARSALRVGNATATDFDYRTMRWKTFDLELVVAHVEKGNLRLVTLTTQVPLARRAVQVNLLGLAADEARLLGEFQSILGSLDGQSSWLSDAERSERLGRLVGFLVVGLGALTAVAVVRRRRQRAGRASR
jgi:hypothetical protein